MGYLPEGLHLGTALRKLPRSQAPSRPSPDSPSRVPASAPTAERPSHIRYVVVSVLFFATAVNYADRATISIVGTAMSKALGLGPIPLGYALSAFSWAYVAAQIPGGWILDRFGSKRTYLWSIGLWSFFTLLQGTVGVLGPGTSAIVTLFTLRLLLGFAEAPSFPANGRIVATWFPTAERGFASAVFNAAQYAALVIFAPLMGVVANGFGWRAVFVFMGGLGLVLWALWPLFIHSPREHPWANAGELSFIEKGGALVDVDGQKPLPFRWSVLAQLLSNRMILGIYLGQYCINVLTWFFLTWFPIYLVKQRHMSILQAGFVAALPALCGLAGGLIGGYVSDWLLKRGLSLTLSRKLPIVAGLLLSIIIVGCNYVTSQTAVVVLMSLAFFGKGVGSLGWALISDVSPKEILGQSGALFNSFGNAAGIVTPIAIGYILDRTGSFNGALVFVGAHAAVGVISFVGIVGEIKRTTLRPA